jgi:transcriptional regulator with XRE-family HTH domain
MSNVEEVPENSNEVFTITSSDPSTSTIAILIGRRKQLRLTQRELARRMGENVSAGSISEWETGKHEPTLSSLMNWVRALGGRLAVDLIDKEDGSVLGRLE